MSLARVAIRGAYFTSIALALRQMISLATTFYVARQLAPADLGLFSMVMLVIGLAQVIGDVGIATGLVRSQNNSAEVLDTCFWIGAGIGTVLSLLVIVFAPWAGAFYTKPEIVPFLRASAIGLLINFLMPVPMAMLQQRLAYKEISLAQVLGSFCGACATVGLVYAGAGTWALVFQPVVGNVVLVGVLMLSVKWLPGFQINLAAVRDIMQSGMHLLGSGLAGYSRNNFDTLVIGRALQAKDLGIYSLAQTILYAPMHLIGSTVSRVLFPLLAKLQDEPDRLREAVLAATAKMSLLILPLYFGIIVLADEFVLNLFGAKWIEMALLIKIIAVASLLQSISNVSGPLMLALGRSKIVFGLSLGGALFYFVILLAALPYGLTAVAIGYAIANSIVSLVSLAVTLHYAAIPARVYAQTVLKPLLMTLFTVGVVMLAKQAVDGRQLLGFAGLCLIGGACYAALIFHFEKSTWQQMLQALRR